MYISRCFEATVAVAKTGAPLEVSYQSFAPASKDLPPPPQVARIVPSNGDTFHTLDFSRPLLATFEDENALGF